MPNIPAPGTQVPNLLFSQHGLKLKKKSTGSGSDVQNFTSQISG